MLCYFMLIVGIILLFMIEDVMCCLCELCYVLTENWLFEL